MHTVRPPAVAGMFYPADPKQLAHDIGQFLLAAPICNLLPKALIVPHAGYVYSGTVAAAAYICLKPITTRIRRVVLLGPTHRVAVRGLALPGVNSFETPLGQIEIDKLGVNALTHLPQVITHPETHALEHSLEVQLTAGYIHEAPRRDFFSKMDAANVDLKAFTDEFYVKQTGSHLQPVLDTLKYLRQETEVWIELTTLLIPGLNDSEHEIAEMSEWIVKELGQDVPLHFTAFHPDYKMTGIPATPPATLTRARAIAQAAGLNYVYTGNVHDTTGGSTFCSVCKQPLIVRDWYEIRQYAVTEQGACSHCGAKLAGAFGKFETPFGGQRISVNLGNS